MSDLNHDEIITLADLVRKVENSSKHLSPSDLEDYENGFSRLDEAGYVLVNLAANSLGGKPFVLTSDNPKTIERCTSLAEHLGVSVDKTTFAAGLTRIVVGASPPLLPDTAMRFFVNDDGSILDSQNRMPAVAVCNCTECQRRELGDIGDQIYLRRLVLQAQLSELSRKVVSLCEPEAHALAQVVYWTIYTSQLDWSIGQCEARSPVEDIQFVHAEMEPLSPFLDAVKALLQDLYGDCNPDLLDDLLEVIDVIVSEWEKARTASSRDFIKRVSMRLN
jgi:hypothetical protein